MKTPTQLNRSAYHQIAPHFAERATPITLPDGYALPRVCIQQVPGRLVLRRLAPPAKSGSTRRAGRNSAGLFRAASFPCQSKKAADKSWNATPILATTVPL